MDTELIKKEQFLELVLNNIPSYVFWKDRNSIYLGCNDNFAKSADLNSPYDIIGKSDYDLPWSKVEADFYRKIDKEVMDSGQSQINFEEPQTLKDGSIRWIRTSKIPLYDDNKEIRGILGTYEDITDRKSMELELIDRNKTLVNLNSKLETINIELEQFAYATSHDLQEPLRIISSFTQLFENHYAKVLDKQGLSFLKFIKDGANRMSTLIQQMLYYTKIEKVEEVFKPVDIESLVAEELKHINPIVKEKQASITYNLPMQKVSCRPKRIKALFNNLILNGIHFNKSATPTIKIDFHENEKEWRFTVSDNGIGIDQQYQKYIFQPFKRLNKRQEFPGNGIGLFICRRIVKLHGGRIWFTENEPQGTIFHFTICKETTKSNLPLPEKYRPYLLPKSTSSVKRSLYKNTERL